MPTRVIVLGGGVAGMSAAHELIERGFEVVVLERGQLAGGKARSIPVTDDGAGTSGHERADTGVASAPPRTIWCRRRASLSRNTASRHFSYRRSFPAPPATSARF